MVAAPMSAKIDVQPQVYPRCSECKAPAVLRRLTNLIDGTSAWYWQRDCKHRGKKPDMEVVDERPKRGKKSPKLVRTS